MGFHWRLSDSKSPQVSRTLLSILAVFTNAVVWMVSTRPPSSKSSRPFKDPLVTVPKAPMTIGIIVTFLLIIIIVCLFVCYVLLRPRKGSLMKTQTRILDNRLYYTRKIELHRKDKSRTVRITPILICGIWWPAGMCGTRPFLWRVRVQGRSPHTPGISKNALGPVGIPLIRGASGAGRWTQPSRRR